MESYYLGLSMGTRAVGWAVTDTQYHLLRKKGRDTWGVRLFDEASTGADRRTFRTSRRRRQREKARIEYVKGIFADAVNAVDPDFFKRLEDSFFYAEDKEILQPNSLFADPDFTDRDYFGLYPTAFHLRSDLLHSGEPRDVRLVFLAVLNIFKHRGHFLNADLSEDGIADFEPIYAAIAEKSDNLASAPDLEAVKEALSSDQVSASGRYHRIAGILGVTKKMPEDEVLKLMCGLKGAVPKIFPEHKFADEYKSFSFSFRDSDYEEADGQLQELLDGDEYDFLQLVKQAHDWSLLENIMKGEQYLSDAMIRSYEKHAADLSLLKLLYKKYCSKDKFDDMFRIMGNCNYSSYVGSVSSNLEKARRCPEKEKKEGLYKRLTADIMQMQKDHPDDVDIAYVLEELEKGTFLPKQRTTDNRVIPYQMNLKELRKIISNAEGFLPFLKDIDDSGLTASERIARLFAFRIPYYIGPLYNDGQHNAWAIRKAPGKVFPWNLEEKIDVKASSEAFIERMVGECTYLPGEKVLPRCSLLYERYTVLSEINKLRVNGAPISVGLKKGIYTDLFCKYKKVTLKKVKDYITEQGLNKKDEVLEISGVDDGFNTSLASYLKFCTIFRVTRLTHEQEKIAEKIIYWSTVYGESRSLLKGRIEETYGDILDADQVRMVCAARFSGWGNLSEALLKLAGEKRYSQEDRPRTIIDRMWETNAGLMECLGDEYTYSDALQAMNTDRNKVFSEVTYEDLEDLYISAPVRRMLWQTILVIREVTGVMGHAPARIFLEVDRDANIVNKKQRGLNRKKRLIDLYKKHKDKERDWVKEITDTDPSRFLIKKLYLYYLQKGRCMYTGEPIRLSDLFDDSLYNIDHIYPKNFVMDDSIEKNLVLVSTKANEDKGNGYPLSPRLRSRLCSFWKTLCREGFMTKEKYERLIRSTPFSDEELAGFVGIQSSDTRQGTKIISNMFRKSFPGTEVCHVKAFTVNEFRRKFKLLRCADLNDLYHAEDAYLNIVVGNCYHVKFTENPVNFIREARKYPGRYKYHMYKLFDYPIVRNGDMAWDMEGEKSIGTVRRVMEKTTPMVTMMNYTKHGKLWKQTIHNAGKAGAGSGYIPVKSSDERLKDMSRYGGYCNYTGAYFFLVEHTSRKKRIRTLESVPLYMMDGLSTDEELISYCILQLGYIEPRICMRKIKMYSLIRVNGFYMYLTGRTCDRLCFKSAVDLKVPLRWGLYIKRIFSGQEVAEPGENEKPASDAISITKDNNLALYRFFTKKNTEGIFASRPGALGRSLASWEEAFAKLGVNDQLYVLRAIVAYDSGKNPAADMRLLGGTQNTGRATINKMIDGYDEFLLISESPAGFYQKVTDLQRV